MKNLPTHQCEFNFIAAESLGKAPARQIYSGLDQPTCYADKPPHWLRPLEPITKSKIQKSSSLKYEQDSKGCKTS